MSTSFEELGIIPSILESLTEMGYKNPTDVQREAIPHILNGEDLIVMSKTGSGKTAVYGVSMVQKIDQEKAGPQGLILVPTRELAVQVENDLKLIAKHTGHRTTSVYGQHSITIEQQALKKSPAIVAGTPGRVFDHIEQGSLITKNIKYLVLDEADRMLDMGFIDQVVRIVKRLPQDRITLLFSATIPPEVKVICQKYMKQPYTIEIESPTMTVDTIEQLYYRVEHNEKRTWLNNILLLEKPQSCLIFCNTRMTVDRVANFLFRKGYAVQALHGDIPQSKRLKTMGEFKQGQVQLLVATDVAARGIHVDDLALVINYDVPVEKDSYVHRIGRTGRAGNIGKAISLVTRDDIMGLYEIEEHIGVIIEERDLPSASELKAGIDSASEWIKEHSHNQQTDTGSNKPNSRKKATSRTAKPRERKKPSSTATINYNEKIKGKVEVVGKAAVVPNTVVKNPKEANKPSLTKKVTTNIVIGPSQKTNNNPEMKTEVPQAKLSPLKKLVNFLSKKGRTL